MNTKVELVPPIPQPNNPQPNSPISYFCNIVARQSLHFVHKENIVGYYRNGSYHMGCMFRYTKDLEVAYIALSNNIGLKLLTIPLENPSLPKHSIDALSILQMA